MSDSATDRTVVVRTFELPARVSEVLDAIAAEQQLSPDAAVRQALVLYQLVHERNKRGKPIDFRDPDLPPMYLPPGGPGAAP